MSRRRKSGYFRPYSLQNGIPRIDLLHIKSAADLLVCSAIDPPLRCARRDCTMTRFVTRFTIIFLGLSVSALAQGQPDNWYGAASIVYNDDNPDRVLDDSLSGFQISVGRDINDYVSLEGLLGYSDISAFCEPGNCYPDQRHIDVAGNILISRNRDRAFVPYILVGVGYLGVGADDGPQFVSGTGDGGATTSIGLGFKWRMGQSQYSLRVEQRARLVIDTNNMTDQLTTIGLQYDFGWHRPEPEPETQFIYRDVDTDSDHDHVGDRIDECPNTPIGVPVDRRGCSQDSDMDGVTTDKDRCPGSRPGADVDIHGCENDEDKDGVPDHRDSCPSTRPGVRTDVRGCEIREIISLPGISFETGADALISGTEYLLQQAADTLNKNPELRIEVAGHTDDVGNAMANEGLSERRAETVHASLIRYGVNANRLTFRGYGESQPIADNSSAEGRAVNRRVELRLVSQ